MRFVTRSSLSTPFWNEINVVPGPTIGLICSRTVSVSHSLTASNTKSATPRSAGLSEALTGLTQILSGPPSIGQSVRAHGRQVRAPGKEANICTALREARAKVASETSCTDHRYAHSELPRTAHSKRGNG